MQTFTRSIGVLGGLGPKTTAEFYERLVELGTREERPAVCIWSLPMNVNKEIEYIKHGENREYYFALLEDGLCRLAQAGSTQIVIPCNTVHEFHGRLQNLTHLPVTNLIEIVADEVKERGWKSVALLTTSRTRNTNLYQDALAKRGITWRFPSNEDQRLLDQLVQGLLGDVNDDAHQKFLGNLIEKMGETHIVLGCTDLQLALVPSENIIDSLAVLVKKTVQVV